MCGAAISVGYEIAYESEVIIETPTMQSIK